jgi:hypothetical protein
LDQSANPKVGYPSLNYQTGCLIVVDTFRARQTETRARELARGIRTLIQWLSHDVLALAGPKLATRRELFDFITDELERLEPKDTRRDDLLAFAGVLDNKLAGIAQALEISLSLVREACMLHRLPTISSAYWHGTGCGRRWAPSSAPFSKR